MNDLIKKIDYIIEINNSKINENIVGINYLEKLKYLVIDNLKNGQDKLILDDLVTTLEKKNNQSIKFKFKNRPLFLSINLYKNPLSKIKLCCNNDTLSIVINGVKKILLFDLYDKKKKISLPIFKNMGIVLSENTITSEKIEAGSIIMDIVSEKKAMNIEN
jgi:hypothetical protein